MPGELKDLSEKELRNILLSPKIKKVVCYCLGPRGTNIGKAAKEWAKKMGVHSKTEIVFCDTPEESVEKAKKIKEDGVLAVFWTCAVYVGEAELFFTNPDTFPFFFVQEMDLDGMQLATRPELFSEIKNGQIPKDWKIASHPSPAPLVRKLGNPIVFANSNAHAAQMCQQGKTELCITTESARRTYKLEKVFSFGSPPMIFFGGITRRGLELIKKCL
jgi:hypothetical protein